MFATSLLAGLLAAAASTASAAPSCKSFTIPVAVENAQNRVVLAPGFNLSSVSGVTSFISSGGGLLGQLAGFIPVSGTYNIAAQYCAPQKNAKAPASRAKEVQLLLHGVPYNMTYWFGLPGNPAGSEEYNWVEYATSQGYPVLAIDNLGAGNSDKPDPILHVQQPLQTAILLQISKMLRAGKVKYAPKASKIIYVGHSLASVQGNGIATHNPSAFDALILTGYSYTLAQAALELVLTVLEPAQLANPSKFGTDLPGYLVFGSRNGKRETYYDTKGSFSQALANYDFDHEDTITIGQIYTAFTGLEKAADFTGDVLVVTGQEDALFCGTGNRHLGPQNCGEGDSSIPAMSKAFWPKANFQYYLAPKTSHATTLHYSTPGSIKRAHAFLKQAGY